MASINMREIVLACSQRGEGYPENHARNSSWSLPATRKAARCPGGQKPPQNATATVNESIPQRHCFGEKPPIVRYKGLDHQTLVIGDRPLGVLGSCFFFPWRLLYDHDTSQSYPKTILTRPLMVGKPGVVRLLCFKCQIVA